MENRNIFLDTNIVADMIDADREHHKRSLELLRLLILGEYDIFISEDMLSTLYYISRDKKATLAFFENVVFIDWHVVPFGRDVLREATHMALTQGVDLEDTLQCLCAKKNKCMMLVTSDQAFVDCGIETVGYEKFVS